MFSKLGSAAFVCVFAVCLVRTSLSKNAHRSIEKCPSQCECLQSIVRCTASQLLTVPHGVPQGTTVLDLRFSQIRTLRKGDFRRLIRLETLFLNNNLIERIEDGAFEGLTSLRSLYLYRNKLRRLSKGTFVGLASLEELNLDMNEISQIDTDTFSGLNRLNSLSLSNNRLSSVPFEVIKKLRSLDSLKINSNPLNCDCQMVGLANYLKNNPHMEQEHEKATCERPRNLRGRILSDLPQQALHCFFPTVIEDPKSVEIKRGENAMFTCKIAGDPEPKIDWYHNETLVDRLKQRRYNTLENGSLEIKEAQLSDAGFYECHAKNRRGSTRTKRAQLQYKKYEYQRENEHSVLPQITQAPVDVEVDQNEPAQFQCSATGYPPPIIDWKKDDAFIPTDPNVFQRGTMLVVRQATRRNAGRYTCIAVNGNGHVSATAELRVRFRPEFTLTPGSQSVREGSRVTITCEVVAYPAPNMSWMKESAPLKQSRRVTVTQQRRAEGAASTVAIYPLLREDIGIYTCRAQNVIGSVQSKGNLRMLVSKSPEITEYPVSVSTQLGNTVTFRCKSTGEPIPHIIWHFNGSPIPTIRGHYEVSDDNSLAINGVRSSDQGIYTCQAVNDVGAMAAEATLEFQAGSEENVSPPLVTGEVIRNSIAQATRDVDNAINATRLDLYDGKAKSPSQLLALFRFPPPQAIPLARAREIYEQTLHYIKGYVRRGIQLNMTTDKEFNYESVLSVTHLQLIMLSSGCTPGQFKDPCSDMCFHSQYRSYDGQCNNLQHPMWGVSLMPFKRNLPPIYENGFNLPVGWDPTRTYYGHIKPNAREVSLSVISSSQVSPDPKYSAMLMQWGQFLDHDITFTAGAPSRENFANGALCNRTCSNLAPCFNIRMPINDPRRSKAAYPCIEFERSSAVCGSGETSLIYR